MKPKEDVDEDAIFAIDYINKTVRFINNGTEQENGNDRAGRDKNNAGEGAPAVGGGQTVEMRDSKEEGESASTTGEFTEGRITERTLFRRAEQMGEDEVVLTGNAVAALGERVNVPVRVVDDVESLPEKRKNKKGWSENGHRAMRMIYGDDLSEVERVYNNIPEPFKGQIEEELYRRKYEKVDHPEEAMCILVEDMYKQGAFRDNNYDLVEIFGGVNNKTRDFINFVQQLIDFVNYGGEKNDTGELSREGGSRLEGGQNTQKRNTEGREEGTGVAEATTGTAEATGGLTEEVNSQEGETLFSKKELTSEQKKKQEALKENAKAIRRLHNVKANYPITALRNLGFALEAQEQREMHDRLFAERDAMSGRENAVSVEVNPQGMTLQERITESLLKMAEQITEIITKSHTRELEDIVRKQIKTGAEKVNASGVDKYGQLQIGAFNEGVKLEIHRNKKSLAAFANAANDFLFRWISSLTPSLKAPICNWPYLSTPLAFTFSAPVLICLRTISSSSLVWLLVIISVICSAIFNKLSVILSCRVIPCGFTSTDTAFSLPLMASLSANKRSCISLCSCASRAKPKFLKAVIG